MGVGSVVRSGQLEFSPPDVFECANRIESVRNREYGWLRIDIDVQVFLWLHLSEKLEPFEIVLLEKEGFS